MVETHGSLTYVGRYDSEDERGVLMLNVGVHDAVTGGGSKEEYIGKSAQFGIRADHQRLLVPAAQVARITRLAEVS